MTIGTSPPLCASASLWLNQVCERFGIESFRPLQADCLEAVRNHRDLLAVMPTGSGKSLCYQAPAALWSKGLTLVVCPLISLMEDQVAGLKRRNIPAAFLNSRQHPREQDRIEHAARDGKLTLLYVAPERVLQPLFVTLLSDCYAAQRLEGIVIDEAHCITEWGQDFRPDYGRLGKLRRLFPTVPIHAFTATATPSVRQAIIERLALRDSVELVGDFDRPNLTLRVHERHDGDAQIIDLLESHRGGPAIVYCITVNETHRVSDMLEQAGVSSLPYNGKMNGEDRTYVQQAFMAGDLDVVVATIAFGMGIDRPDVRLVIHAAMPSSIEVYHQEIGRAGRDGKPAECVLLYDPNDLGTWCHVMRIAMGNEDTEDGDDVPDTLAGKLAALDDIDMYCTGDNGNCRHAVLTEHFGQPWPLERDTCNACDCCLGE